MTLDRREFGRRVVGGAVGLTLPAVAGLGAARAQRPAASSTRAPAAAQPPAVLPQDLDFRILRNGSEIGTHRVAFKAAQPGRITVQTRIELSVKLLMFTAFRYRQEAEEVWQGDRVVWLKCRTDDDGDVTEVNGALNGNRFRVSGPVGQISTRPDLLTSNSLWTPRVVEHHALIDLQRGDEVDLAVRRIGQGTVRVGSAEVTAQQHQVATRRVVADLWHDAGGRWVKAMFQIKGHTIEYILAG